MAHDICCNFVFVECLSSMDRFLLTTCLLFALCGTCTCNEAPKPHVDYTQEPHIHRSCREVHCSCGKEPRICSRSGHVAKCVPCSPYTFQPDEISSVEIVDGRQCRPHKNCTKGWHFVWLLMDFVVIIIIYFNSLSVCICLLNT